MSTESPGYAHVMTDTVTPHNSYHGKKIYFKNLNGFRFLAASGVIITHIELYKARLGQPNAWTHPLIFELGSAAVDFFFVLSGFLITYLLLEEKRLFKTINFRMFYTRRILRIWPLYYFIILLAFFVLPNLPIMYTPGYSDDLFVNNLPKLISCLLIFPNVALEIFGNIPYASPSWSIGVEEQFYIVWPFLIALSSKPYRSILIFIAFFIALKIMMYVVGKLDLIPMVDYVRIKDLVVATRMECMGIGGFGAVLLFRQSPVLKLLNKKLEVVLIAAVFLTLYFSAHLFELHHIILSVIFLGIILHAVYLQNSTIKLENPFFKTMGKLSYGIYMYHTICITIVYKLFYAGPFESSLVIKNLMLYIGSFALAIGVAALSYRFLESRFLKIKVKYAKVLSGDAAGIPGS